MELTIFAQVSTIHQALYITRWSPCYVNPISLEKQ